MDIVQINRHAPCVQGFRPQMLATNLAVPLFFPLFLSWKPYRSQGLSTGPEQSFPSFLSFCNDKKNRICIIMNDLIDYSIVTDRVTAISC